MESIRELLVDEMRDLYDAEKQLVKALPKVVKASSAPGLSEAFEKHLEQTQEHVQRLERAFELLGERPKSKSCAAMQGLIQEAGQAAKESGAESLTDSAIICAAQKVEHYEIAGYGTLIAWAKALELDEVAELLSQTLEEEKAADETLSNVADEILASAMASEEGSEEQQDGDGRVGTSGNTPHKKATSMKTHKATDSRRTG
ncbi:MAG TPA: ferritin-like domain-containing protein [Bryobacteraceae bacterium]|jgi:ferritin-like metal-binding protein YciE